jgi:hypothetical protein
MIRFTCPTCPTRYEVPDYRAGQKAYCLDCGNLFQVPNANVKLTEAELSPPSAQSGPMTEILSEAREGSPWQHIASGPANEHGDEPSLASRPEFACHLCGDAYQVNDELVGKVIRCRTCREFGRVLEPKGTSRPQEKNFPPPVSSPLPRPEGPDVPVTLHPAPACTLPTPIKFWKGLILGLIGCILLLAAWWTNADLTAKDKREEELNMALGDLFGQLSGKYEYKETRLSDRSPVYCLASLGVILIGLGVVCLAIENKPREPSLTPDKQAKLSP